MHMCEGRASFLLQTSEERAGTRSATTNKRTLGQQLRTMTQNGTTDALCRISPSQSSEYSSTGKSLWHQCTPRPA